jgi:hypothetical protein
VRFGEHSTLAEMLEQRIAALGAWLGSHAPACGREQAHLDEGSRERAYWHYGYLMALRDVLDVVSGRRDTLH